MPDLHLQQVRLNCTRTPVTVTQRLLVPFPSLTSPLLHATEFMILLFTKVSHLLHSSRLLHYFIEFYVHFIADVNLIVHSSWLLHSCISQFLNKALLPHLPVPPSVSCKLSQFSWFGLRQRQWSCPGILPIVTHLPDNRGYLGNQITKCMIFNIIFTCFLGFLLCHLNLGIASVLLLPELSVFNYMYLHLVHCTQWGFFFFCFGFFTLLNSAADIVLNKEIVSVAFK